MAVTRNTIPVEDGDLPLTVARGEGRGAAVVVVPSAFGVAEDLVEQLEEMAHDAVLAVSFDPFFRGDGGPVPYEDMPRVLARLQVLDRARTLRDLHAVLTWVRQEAADPPVVVVGICFGGPLAVLAAADGLVDGVVTWHGTRLQGVLGRAADVRCPMRLHFGADDPFVPPDVVDAVRSAFADHPDVEVVVHEGVTHGYSHRAAARAYDPEAEQAGMAAVRELVTTVG